MPPHGLKSPKKRGEPAGPWYSFYTRDSILVSLNAYCLTHRKPLYKRKNESKDDENRKINSGGAFYFYCAGCGGAVECRSTPYRYREKENEPFKRTYSHPYYINKFHDDGGKCNCKYEKDTLLEWFEGSDRKRLVVLLFCLLLFAF
jgi:hypothetical protein